MNFDLTSEINGSHLILSSPFSYISFSYFTFPGTPNWIFLLYFCRHPCFLFLVIEQQLYILTEMIDGRLFPFGWQQRENVSESCEEEVPHFWHQGMSKKMLPHQIFRLQNFFVQVSVAYGCTNVIFMSYVIMRFRNCKQYIIKPTVYAIFRTIDIDKGCLPWDNQQVCHQQAQTCCGPTPHNVPTPWVIENSISYTIDTYCDVLILYISYDAIY